MTPLDRAATYISLSIGKLILAAEQGDRSLLPTIDLLAAARDDLENHWDCDRALVEANQTLALIRLAKERALLSSAKGGRLEDVAEALAFLERGVCDRIEAVKG